MTRSITAATHREERVRAFSYLNAAEAIASARTIDEGPPGSLSGLTFGIKDLIDTAGVPTSYGSRLYSAHRPESDAAVVGLIKASSGCLLGKTVTTEFALMTAGPTTNPHRESHTPGGSSSGSAAGVAAGMIDVGIGTQTYGSVIRPAAFCGVFGFKPSYGAVPTEGVRQLSRSFDTIGWMACTLELIERVFTALASTHVQNSDALRIGTVYAGDARRSTDAIRSLPGVHHVAAEAVPVSVVPLSRESQLEAVSGCHEVVAQHEIGRSLLGELTTTRPEAEAAGGHAGLSAPLREFVRRGLAISDERRMEAQAELDTRRTAMLQTFEDVDVILAPAAPGEAPRGLRYTGDPRYCTPWTALGCPTLTAPVAEGHTGLPIGVQLVAAPGRDACVLRAATELFPGLRCRIAPVTGDQTGGP